VKNTDITNKKILIAGASSDIGLSLIKHLINDSNIIGLHGNTSLERLKNFECKNIKLFNKNLNSPENGILLIEEYVTWAGGIDIFIQLTGIITNPCSWEEITPGDWNNDLLVNLSVPFFMARESIKFMKEGGKIILISTASASHGGGEKSIAYGVAKGGIETVTKGLAKFAGKKGILTNCICPGFINTRMQVRSGKSQEDIKNRVNTIPLNKSGQPEDVAAVIAFLISPKNNYINGQCIVVDGGDFI